MTYQWVAGEPPTDSGSEDPPKKRTAAPSANGNGGKSNASKTPKDIADSSALVTQVAVTIFPTIKGNRKREDRLSLIELEGRIRDTEADDKASLPYVKLATFGVHRTDRGSFRSNENMLSIHGIEADYDAGELAFEDACRQLSEADLAALLWTTPSHTTESPRYRILCPTSRKLPVADRKELVARLNGALGGVLDGASFTDSQAMSFGHVAGKPSRVKLVPGRFIDVADDLDARAIGKRPATPQDASASPVDAIPEFTIADASDVLDDLPSGKWRDGERQDWLSVGMALHHQFDGSPEAFALWNEWSRPSPLYVAKDIRRDWRSFRDKASRPVTMRTLIAAANEARRELEWDGIPDEFEDLSPEPSKPSRLSFLSPAECEASAPRGYVWKGVLAPRDVGCIFGAPGVGKSLIAPHVAYMVAQGAPAFHLRTNRGDAFYVAAEDESGMRGRVTALRDRHGDARRFTLVCGVSNLLSKESEDLKALREAIAEVRPALVIVDTLAMAFPGLEENSAEAMGRVIAVARKLTEHGAAVILVHHDTKAEGQTPRGHSVLNGALDMALHLTKDAESGIVRGKLTKNRNGTCDRDIAFRIETRSFGTDDDGDPVTAALAEELAPGSAPKVERLSASEQAALDILKEMGGRAHETAWREACVNGRTVSASETYNSRWRATDRAIARLSQKQMVAFSDGRFAIPSEFDWEDEDEI